MITPYIQKYLSNILLSEKYKTVNTIVAMINNTRIVKVAPPENVVKSPLKI
jgi:hypothetical protein